ncbi:MAG: S46 family peptidase [Bacteroidia bacterium]|nr:S46 family peptidase [Bacteroidia bacterium]
MKKYLFLLSILIFLIKPVKADEGMWLPQLLGEQVYADMVKKGLKLTKEQLYSINKASIKDAIIIFGGGCTGEIVSKEGLIFTNHHCGYNAIAAASSVQHDYLKDGFWAKNKSEEIYSKGVHAQFLVRIEDVTDKVNEKLKDLSKEEIPVKLQSIMAEIGKKSTEGTELEGRVHSFFKDNQFLLFVYERYKDVRLVGTPPESIGKFGGDTDNWEWPRHTGDFSIFRVYMSKDGKPAEYSPDNVPYKAKHFLPISIKGLKDGDYTMIYGYPGGTNRYETSFGVKLKTDVENPSLVELRDVRLKFMLEEMKKDPAVKIQLAGNYAYIANYWKFFDGESKQLLKYKVYEQKQKSETEFNAWAKGKPEYENLFADIAKTYESWSPYAKHRVYIREGILGSPLVAYAANLTALHKALANPNAKPEEITAVKNALKGAYEKFIGEENIPSDKNILGAMVQMFYNNVNASQHPSQIFKTINTRYGDLNSNDTYKKLSENVFSNTMFLSKEKTMAFIENPDTNVLLKDPAYEIAFAFVSNFNTNYAKYLTDFTNKNTVLNRAYLKGYLEKNKGKTFYPDANFTMRVSYGHVKSYSPKDAVKYSHVCTMKGVMEKYVPGDYEFDLPKKQIDLIKAKDYGQYKDAATNDIVVGFITTNDITGGNSGSPVINAKGELVGLAFDGNYEALSHKIAFDKDLNRTICVDIRYVLWVVEKLGGATNIINELDLRKM